MKRWITRIVLMLLVGGGGTLVYLDDQHSFEFETEKFTFESGGNELAATIHLPPGGGPHGIVVFVPGDGPAEIDPAIYPIWETLGDAGYATVHWNKPGVGASTGNWLDQDMDDRADEVVDVLESLANRDDINTSDVGVIGVSQGGWVIPLVADRIDVDFFIAWSAAINWLEQGSYLTEVALDKANAAPDLRARVNEGDVAGDELLNGTYQQYVDWHASLDDDVADFFGLMDRDRWEFVVRNHQLDASDSLPAMAGKPVLLLLAGEDDNVDVADTEKVYRRILTGPCLKVIHYPNADHNLLDHDGLSLILAATFRPRSIFAAGMLGDIESFVDGPGNC